MLFPEYAIRFQKSLFWRLTAKVFDSFSKNSALTKLVKPKKILVIRKDEIGDLILSIPMYESLKKAYPKSELTVLVGNQSSSLLDGNPYVDKILKIETIRNNRLAFIRQYFDLASKLKKDKFDLGMDPKGSILNIILMYLAKVKERISYWNVSGGKFLLTKPVKYEKQVSELDAGLDLLGSMGIKKKRIIPRLYLSKAEVKEGNNISSSLPKGYCCVYITPTLPCKSWPIEYWRELFNKFPDTKFLIISKESDKVEIEKTFSGVYNVQILCLKSLRILSVILKNAKAIITVDGGIMHLAWISNPKTISLFGQNDLILWKPLRGKTISHFPESEQGLNRKTFDYNKPNKYMTEITVQEVEKILWKYIIQK